LKRSDALRALSREHHQALAVGRALSLATDVEQATGRFLEFWKREGALHFRIEEEVLLPYWGVLGSAHAESAARVAREHLQLRSAALYVAAGAASLASIRALGIMLIAHVRFEERELFPLIEAGLGAAELEYLAGAVADAEGGR
jgi:hypothetical protein